MFNFFAVKMLVISAASEATWEENPHVAPRAEDN